MKHARVVVIAGPTASGKSSIAVELAKKFDGQVINADSRQFYRELHVGTAKPSVAEMDGVVHHLIDCASIHEAWNAGHFAKEARSILSNNPDRVFFVVGGTGLYIKALFEGLNSIPDVEQKIYDQLHQQLNQSSLSAFYEKLKHIDPQFAEGISPQDTQRILRGLAVHEQTGKTLTSFWSDDKDVWPGEVLKVALDWPRDQLYERINERVIQMFKNGLIQEAKQLWKNFPDNEVLAKTIGYREWKDLADENEVLSLIQKNTRHFAKRQLTWFRADQSIQWFSPSMLTALGKAVEHFIYETSQ